MYLLATICYHDIISNGQRSQIVDKIKTEQQFQEHQVRKFN